VLSFFKPAWVAFFALVLVAYWMFRASYFSFHLRSAYKQMKIAEKVDWIEKLNNLESISNGLAISNWKEVYHLIVFPMYKEPYEVVKESIEALLETDYPKDKLIVVLAQEERGGEGAAVTGRRIKQEFGGKFFKFLLTIHPYGLPGEIAGKASNEGYADKRAKQFLDESGIDYEKVIFSSFDIDSVVSSHYFSCLSYNYLTTEKPLRTSYQPIPLFLNNVWQAPALSRLFSFSTSFWQITNQEREDKLITFSSHSMPFKTLVEIGFKQPDIVSDDSRIFWQCLLFFDGDYRVKSLFCPVSMDANAAETLRKTLINVYRQERRWAYGVGEVPYFLFGFMKNKKIPFKKKLSLGYEIIEGHWNWACAPVLLACLGWLPTVVGGSAFNQTIFSYNLPRLTGAILTIAMLGLFSYMYYTFCLLPPRKGRIKKLWAVAQWVIFPFTMVFLISIPAIDAQTRLMLGKYMGFWPTPKHR